MWIVDKLAWDNRIVHPSVDQLVDYDANHMINLPFPKKKSTCCNILDCCSHLENEGGGGQAQNRRE